MDDAPLHGMDIPHALNIVIRGTRNGEQPEDEDVQGEKSDRWPYVDLCTEAGDWGGWDAAEKRSQGLKDAGALTGSIQANHDDHQLAAWIVSPGQGSALGVGVVMMLLTDDHVLSTRNG